MAVISLAVAIAALSYNSWRNEHSEDNRNHRAAGFEIMREAAHLQLTVDRATYASNFKDDDAIQGWVRVNLIVSLSKTTTKEIKEKALALKKVWEENWSQLYQSEEANKKVTKSINLLVEQVSFNLKSLR